jgi:hypothetical protein
MNPDRIPILDPAFEPFVTPSATDIRWRWVKILGTPAGKCSPTAAPVN